MTSIFTRIYSYRQRENRNQKEDYLTEIFAFCLENDSVFLSDFFNLLEIKNTSFENCTIQTQVQYPPFGRPDLEIICDDIHILIESKVEHFERINQLTDYESILEDSIYEDKHLVYLTKYYEEKLLKKNFHLIRWFQIYDLINENHNLFTEQLKNYLKEEKMADSKSFDNDDLVVMQRMFKTISKMDEVLDIAKKHFEETTESSLSSHSARSTALANYGYYRDFKNLKTSKGLKFELNIGFSLESEENIFLFLNFKIPKSNTDKQADGLIKLIESEVKDIKTASERKHHSATFQREVSSFFKEESNVKTMSDYLKECIDKVAELINKIS